MRHATLATLAAGTLGASATAGIVTYEFDITVEQAVPAPDVGDFTPSGTGLVTVDPTAMTIAWEITYEGLTGPIVSPGAHFHGPAEPGETAGVEITLTSGDPDGPTSGVLEGSSPLTMQQLDDVTAGLWYVNIHTAQNPAGEIRGQVVPGPAALGLLAPAALLAGRRRRG